MRSVEAAAREIAEVSTTDKIIVEKSTVPCGTAESLRSIFEAIGDPNVHFDILSNPEFLAEGTAMSDLMSPDRILIGSETNSRALRAAEALADVYAAWVPRERIITMNIWSSELAKLAANCMLAQRISSINSLSALCEATGANVHEISHAVGLDDRIGPKFLKASIGFGGSCFQKDVLSLTYMAETLHFPEVAAYWKAVVDINEWQKERFTKQIIRALNNTIEGKRIAVLGLAYKKNTGDTRESPAIACISQMLAEKAQVAVYDPKVSYSRITDELAAELGERTVKNHLTCCEDVYTACEGASAVVILTEWDLFKTDKVTPSPVLGMYADAAASAQQPTPTLKRCRSAGSEKSWESEVNSSEDENGHLMSPDTPLTGASSPAPTPASLCLASASTDSSTQRMDWKRVSRIMRRPQLVFDGRNVVDAARLKPLGFVVRSIGM